MSNMQYKRPALRRGQVTGGSMNGDITNKIDPVHSTQELIQIHRDVRLDHSGIDGSSFEQAAQLGNVERAREGFFAEYPVGESSLTRLQDTNFFF